MFNLKTLALATTFSGGILAMSLAALPVEAKPDAWYLLSTQQQTSINTMCSTFVDSTYGDDLTEKQMTDFMTCRDTLAEGMSYNTPVIY